VSSDVKRELGDDFKQVYTLFFKSDADLSTSEGVTQISGSKKEDFDFGEVLRTYHWATVVPAELPKLTFKSLGMDFAGVCIAMEGHQVVQQLNQSLAALDCDQNGLMNDVNKRLVSLSNSVQTCLANFLAHGLGPSKVLERAQTIVDQLKARAANNYKRLRDIRSEHLDKLLSATEVYKGLEDTQAFIALASVDALNLPALQNAAVPFLKTLDDGKPFGNGAKFSTGYVECVNAVMAFERLCESHSCTLPPRPVLLAPLGITFALLVAADTLVRDIKDGDPSRKQLVTVMIDTAFPRMLVTADMLPQGLLKQLAEHYPKLKPPNRLQRPKRLPLTSGDS
jgi:hypothetical protein